MRLYKLLALLVTLVCTFTTAGFASSTGLIEQLNHQYPCYIGDRVEVERFFSLESGSPVGENAARIEGDFTKGSLVGSEGKVFLGKSAFNDFIIFTEIYRSKKFLGYNISLSLCEYRQVLSKYREILEISNETGAYLHDMESNGCEVNEVTLVDLYTKLGAYKNFDEADFGPTSFVGISSPIIDVTCNADSLESSKKGAFLSNLKRAFKRNKKTEIVPVEIGSAVSR